MGDNSGGKGNNSQPLVSFIFINYNSSDLLEHALATLFDCEPELDKEVIIVDNASSDRTHLKELLKIYPCRLVLLKKNIGYGGAANRGFSEARGKFVVVANPDIKFTPGAVSELVKFMEENPRAGLVSPQLFYADGTPQPSCRRFPRLRYIFAGRRSLLPRVFPAYNRSKEFLYMEVWRKSVPVEVEAVIGAFMLFRRDSFIAVSGFDERYFLFAEDMDICRRLREKGWQVFIDPNVKVIHYYGGVRRSWRRFSEFHRIKGLYRFFTQGENHLTRFLLFILFAGYFFLIEAAGVLGLWEFEYSWRKWGGKEQFALRSGKLK